MFKEHSDKPTHRYASFDYCYHYFRTSTSEQLNNDKEKSCLVLGFYLASWGMFRGKSFLLKKSLKHYESLIGYIADLNKEYWEIDVHNYDKRGDDIIEMYKNISEKIKDGEHHADLTLVTKIMLGVFGCTPAFDRYFTKTLRDVFKNYSGNGKGFRRVSKESLQLIKIFYYDNKEDIDKLSNEASVIDFTGKNSKFNYPKAKIIDMYGFYKSLPEKYKN